MLRLSILPFTTSSIEFYFCLWLSAIKRRKESNHTHLTSFKIKKIIAISDWNVTKEIYLKNRNEQ